MITSYMTEDLERGARCARHLLERRARYARRRGHGAHRAGRAGARSSGICRRRRSTPPRIPTRSQVRSTGRLWRACSRFPTLGVQVVSTANTSATCVAVIAAPYAAVPSSTTNAGAREVPCTRLARHPRASTPSVLLPGELLPQRCDACGRGYPCAGQCDHLDCRTERGDAIPEWAGGPESGHIRPNPDITGDVPGSSSAKDNPANVSIPESDTPPG